MSTENPLHAALTALHNARRRLLFKLENAATDGKPVEDILIAISENRGETRATLRFLQDEVATRPADLSQASPIHEAIDTARADIDAPIPRRFGTR